MREREREREREKERERERKSYVISWVKGSRGQIIPTHVIVIVPS